MFKQVKDFLEELKLNKLDLSLDIFMLMSWETQLGLIENDIVE